MPLAAGTNYTSGDLAHFQFTWHVTVTPCPPCSRPGSAGASVADSLHIAACCDGFAAAAVTSPDDTSMLWAVHGEAASSCHGHGHYRSRARPRPRPEFEPGSSAAKLDADVKGGTRPRAAPRMITIVERLPTGTTTGASSRAALGAKVQNPRMPHHAAPVTPAPQETHRYCEYVGIARELT